MNKNVKRIFLLTTLLCLFITIAGVSAADTVNDDIQDTTVESQIDTSAYSNNAVQTDVNKNTINKENKTIKTEPTENVNYYVSDTDGNDENDGSQQTPFKTIKTAIDKTDSEKIYNIYLSEGIYKGEGNTNLTIDGNNYINIIGAGINKTVFDGEAKFTIPGTGSVWGGSGFWNTWTNTSGNWMMNITSGNGIINIQNLTFQNSWAPSGSSITATQPTIDNRATLNVSNVYFYSNHAGNGAGIRNNYGGTLYVDNCIFENNTKSSTTGNYGAAVYNNGTAIITNSEIVRNYARWGSVTNDKNITLINCTFQENYAYDAASGYKNGPSFVADTGITNYFMMYAVYNLTSTLINCTFQDNQQCDVSNGRGDLIVDNCVFNHSTGVYLFPNTNRLNTYIPSQNITNNQFIDMQPSTVFATTISSTTPSVGVRSLSAYPLLIENNTIDVKDNIYGYGLYLTSNATVRNNTLNNIIYVNNKENLIDGNIINTTRTNTIQLINNAKNTTIINNELYGGYTYGDLSIANVQSDTVFENNTPKTDTFLINDDNYTIYFDENSILRNDVVSNGSKLVFVENLTNKYFIFDNIKVSVDVNTTLYNTTIVTQNNARVLFNNLKISNEKTEEDYVILFETEGNSITNGNINVTTDNPVQVIKIEEDENTITGVTINATMPASDVKWNSDYYIGTVPTAGIFIRSSNNKINNTRLYLYAPTADSSAYSPSVDGIDIQSKAVGEYVTGNEIRSSRINVTGGSYVYGLNIARAKETITPLTYIDVTSTNYAAGIQIGDSDNNNISGYVYSKADNIAYGYYSTAMATGITNNTNVTKLYLQNIQAPTAIGIGIEGASNVELSNATYTINGEKTTAIDISKDWMGNKPENIFINALTINLNGENDTSVMMSIKDTRNVYINRSTIKSTAGEGINLTDVTNATVENNYINAANLIGGNNAVTSNIESTIQNNTPNIAILTDDTYSNFFDENNTLYVNTDIITLGGDLHDKILRFENHTKVINITNADDYTMYNSSIIIAGNGTYGDRYGFTVDRINFNNTDKAVFVDEFNGTGQKNVKFVNTNIYINGDDITAFDAFNNNSYIYLDISYSNITMEGNNVVVIDYSGYNRGQPAYVYNNNITVKAENDAKVFNTEKATIQFNYNNVNVESETSTVANLINTTISYYNFRANNITVTATDASALNMTKLDTYYAYVDQNNIRLITDNPTTAINITGSRTIYVQNNEIVVDSQNGEVPVVYVNVPSSYVRYNYITSKDLAGDDAVAVTTVTISSNTPSSTGYKSQIVIDDNITWYANYKNSLTFDITDIYNQSIEGTVTATINDEEVKIKSNTITYTPTSTDDLTLEITYVDPTGKYNTTTIQTTLTVKNTTLTVDTINATVGDVINITARIQADNQTITDINAGKVVFKVNGKTIKDSNNKVLYIKVVNGTATIENFEIPSTWAKDGITIEAVYSGCSVCNSLRSDKEVMTIQQPSMTFTTDDVTAAKGETITLTATITDSNKVINSGKVVFKVNGKTVKDSKGRTIYAVIKNNSASVTYTIPESYKTKAYEITAVLISNDYDKVTVIKTLTVTD